MSRTIVPKYDQPLVMTIEEVRETLQEWLESARADEDKSGEIENSVYWEGCADTAEGLLKHMTGQMEKEEKPE